MMARTLVLATTLLTVATPAFADKADQLHPTRRAQVATRESAKPKQEAQAPAAKSDDAAAEAPRSLNDREIADVVKIHLADIQACWKQLPAKERKCDANVVLGLAVAPHGDVVDTTIISDAPAETRSCIANVTRQWTFPAVGLASDFEYPVALKAH